jgi:hypothetical protein
MSDAAATDLQLLVGLTLLREGNVSTTEEENQMNTALVLAALNKIDFLNMSELLQSSSGRMLRKIFRAEARFNNQVSNVLVVRFMALRCAPTADLTARLYPNSVKVVQEGARLRAQLPDYFARRRALLSSHTPLIAPLLDMVASYLMITTAKELWATFDRVVL